MNRTLGKLLFALALCALAFTPGLITPVEAGAPAAHVSRNHARRGARRDRPARGVPQGGRARRVGDPSRADGELRLPPERRSRRIPPGGEVGGALPSPKVGSSSSSDTGTTSTIRGSAR